MGKLTRFASAAAAALILAASAAYAADAADAEETVALEFSNADIESVVKAISQISGKNFVIDPRVKGTINVVSGKPVPKSLAYQILLSALRLQGYAIVEEGGIARVLPEADAKTHAGLVGGKAASGSRIPGEQLATEVFQIRFESAAQMVPVLRPLIAPNNAITAYPGNNTLVVTDYADNLRRIEKIIQAIDVAHGDDPEIIPVLHASAYDLAQTLSRVFADAAGSGGDNTQRVTITADGRSNSLIVRCDSPEKRTRVRALIAGLDQPTATAGNIHVVYLRNAEAAKVAQTLRAIVSGDTTEPVSTAQPQFGAGGSTSQFGLGGGTSQFGSGGNTSQSGNTMVQAANTNGGTPSSAGAAPYSRASTGGDGGDTSRAGGMIQADTASNALIIIAPEAVYNNLRNVVDLLDRRRAQVQIEAIIVELTVDKTSEFGIQWQNALGSDNKSLLVGGTNFNTGSSNIVGLAQGVATASTTGTAALSPGLNLGIVNGYNSNGVPNITALLRALQSDDKANILSTPKIVTMDNEEARIIVGQNVPFVTGSFVQAGTTVATPFQTYERQDVGISLKVKPQISEGGAVRIQIYQEVSSLVASSVSNASGPTTNTRAIESTVLVDDGTILALGGLMDDEFDDSVQKVPVLGDLPYVGSLFRYQNKSRTKTNLVIFLRPTIIRDAAGYRGFSTDRYEEMLGAQKDYEKTRSTWVGEGSSPQLPPAPAAAADKQAAPASPPSASGGR